MQRTNVITVSKGISLFLVSFCGVIVLMSAFEQILGLSVLGINVVVSVFVAIALLMCLMKAISRQLLFSVGAGMGIILAAAFISGYFYDIYWDGNAYHKLAVGYLANGWNATWQTVEEFLAECPFPAADFLSRNPPWIDFFPKASWYYGASFYKVFQNIETGKSINILMLSAVFFASLAAFLEFVPFSGRRKMHNVMYCICALFSAAIAACNPIALNQLFTFYVDGLLGSIWCLTIISLFCESASNKKYWLVYRFFLILIGCNLKYTSGAIIGAFCVAQYFLKLCIDLKEKRFASLIKLTVYYMVCCICAFGIVGAGSYIKNTIIYGHPFYPVMTKENEESVNIMAGYLPDDVERLLPIQKWVLVTFSKTESAKGDMDIHLKIPLSVSKEELMITHIDTERGGMGAFYSGLLLISLAYTASVYIRRKKLGRHGVLWVACLVACIVLICIIDASWLARYSPYVYFPIMFAGVQLCAQMIQKREGVAVRAICFVYIGLTLLNSITFLYCARSTVGETRKIRAVKSQAESSAVEVFLPHYEGQVFNFMDDGFYVNRVFDPPDDLNEWYACWGVYWRYKVSGSD